MARDAETGRCHSHQASCSQTDVHDEGCPFLAKLNWNGSALSLLYATYNPIESCPLATAVPYFAPVANFLSEFNSSGALIFSTCLGVPNSSVGSVSSPVLALDTSGNIYMAATGQAGLPLQNPIDANLPGTDVNRWFVSEVSGASHTLVFSSFVAGAFAYNSGVPSAGGDSINGIVVDSSGNIDLVGESTPGVLNGSATELYSFFPVFNAMQPYFAGLYPGPCGDFPCYYSTGLIMKISPSAGAAAALVPAELQFPTTGVATTSAPLGTTVYDLGTDPLTVSNVAVSSDFVIQSNNCTTVAPSGGSCTIQVAFAPTATGTDSGTLTITDNSAGSPHKVALTGQAATTNLTVSPTSLTFASQATGTTSPAQTVTLTAGAAAVQNFRIQISGDFSETNNCGSGIAAGAKCQIQVSFTPKTAALNPGTSRLWMWAFLIAGWIIVPSGMSTKRLARRYLPLLALWPVIFLLSCGGGNTNDTTAPGAFTGTLTITDSAPNSPQAVSLSGT
jgi:hypothetical protein